MSLNARPIYRTPQALLDEFAADWEAALRPSAAETLARCHPERHQELCDLIGAYLLTAPTPPYSPAQRRRLTEKVLTLLDSQGA